MVALIRKTLVSLFATFLALGLVKAEDQNASSARVRVNMDLLKAVFHRKD
jgi:hypothetical protein